MKGRENTFPPNTEESHEEVCTPRALLFGMVIPTVGAPQSVPTCTRQKRATAAEKIRRLSFEASNSVAVRNSATTTRDESGDHKQRDHARCWHWRLDLSPTEHRRTHRVDKRPGSLTATLDEVRLVLRIVGIRVEHCRKGATRKKRDRGRRKRNRRPILRETVWSECRKQQIVRAAELRVGAFVDCEADARGRRTSALHGERSTADVSNILADRVGLMLRVILVALNLRA